VLITVFKVDILQSALEESEAALQRVLAQENRESDHFRALYRNVLLER
jgi:hypothetical protein